MPAPKSKVKSEKPSPRTNADEAYRQFMSMDEPQWQGLLQSTNGAGVGLQPAEYEGFKRAFSARLQNKVEENKANPAQATFLPNTPSSRPAFIKGKTEVVADADASTTDMSKELRALKDRKDTLEEELTSINKRIDELSQKLAEKMENQGVTSFKVPEVGTVYIQTKGRASINGDKDVFNRWLDENNLGAMAKRSVHPSTFESWVKEYMAAGNPIPKAKDALGVEYELFSVFQQKRAMIRR